MTIYSFTTIDDPLATNDTNINAINSSGQIVGRAMTERSVTLKYNPHHRTNIGPKETPAVRVYRSDPEGVTPGAAPSALGKAR